MALAPSTYQEDDMEEQKFDKWQGVIDIFSNNACRTRASLLMMHHADCVSI
jgi:hypothetical protein